MAGVHTLIDGSVLEGGGQILRLAVSLSALLRKPITVKNIRSGRSTPGLRPQHLHGLQLVRDLCDGILIGDKIGSTEISFTPKAIHGGDFTVNVGTAGSVVLLVQVALPCLLFAEKPSLLSLRGGTHVDMAPPVDFTISVLKPLLEKFGVAKLDVKLLKSGYFPKGGGLIKVSIGPVAKLNPIEIHDKGTLTRVNGRSFVAGVLPMKVANTMAAAALSELKSKNNKFIDNIDIVKESPEEAFGNGNGIVLFAETSTGCRFSGCALGKRGTEAHELGKAAGSSIIKELSHGGCVDEHTQDQLIVFMALADGTSRIKCGPVTLHTRTAIYVAELLTDARFNIVESEGDCVIECHGIGLKSKE